MACRSRLYEKQSSIASTSARKPTDWTELLAGLPSLPVAWCLAKERYNFSFNFRPFRRLSTSSTTPSFNSIGHRLVGRFHSPLSSIILWAYATTCLTKQVRHLGNFATQLSGQLFSINTESGGYLVRVSKRERQLTNLPGQITRFIALFSVEKDL